MTTVLVIRKFDNFSRILTENGLTVINCPLIETIPHENSRNLTAKISSANYDGIFLTSQTATEIFCQEIFDKKIEYRGKIYVLGKSSFDRLKDENFDIYFDETANTAQEMLNAISLENLKNRRFLFVRGEKSLGTITEFLTKIAAIDEIIVYQIRKIAIDEKLKKEIQSKLKKNVISGVCFFSPSGAERFLEQFGTEILHQTKIATIGKTTADYFEKRNIKVSFVSSKSSVKDFTAELIDFLNH